MGQKKRAQRLRVLECYFGRRRAGREQGLRGARRTWMEAPGHFTVSIWSFPLDARPGPKTLVRFFLRLCVLYRTQNLPFTRFVR